jgi:serine/threonine protein kinase
MRNAKKLAFLVRFGSTSLGCARASTTTALYPQVFGKYVLERELSRGGMARVILATLRGAGGFEKKLVVKQIRDELAFDQQFVRRFVEEAKTTVALSHPNIVPVYELGVEQGTYFLAMELVEGLSVAELLRDHEDNGSRIVLTPEEGAYVGVEVCRALDYAHRRMKVVHRDITPRNVMIDEEGQIKLIDFGIAAPALVAGHEILGSPGHMAPEQVDGGELGPPTDIFAVAVLLMEAWTGAAPFRRATPEECSLAVREPHPRPSDFDPRLIPLDEAIGRAMNIDPRARQQEASDLARSLRSFLQGLDVHDIARGLGDRVRELRELAAAPEPSTRAVPRASRASHGDLGTKTFAAREEALRWSNRPPSDAGKEASSDVGVPSTRRIESPKSPNPPKATNIARVRRDDPAMSIPTPLMVEVEALEKIHSEIAANRAKAPPKPTDAPTVRRRRVKAPEGRGAEKLETIATRPLETPVRAFEAAGTKGAAGKGSRLYAIFGLVAVVAIGGFAAWRARAPAAPSEPAHVVLTATTPAPTSPAPSDAPSNAVPPPSAVSSAVRVPPSATSSSSVPATGSGKATVAFLGEPGTRVSLDGAPMHACPWRTVVGEGPHEVRFMFDPTGESRGERFSVKNGDRMTVRAEFTGATPTVKIQR